jgi:MFS family permease
VSFRTTLRDLTLMLASMITIIGTTVIAPSLPEMADFFGGSPNAFLVRISLTIPALSAGLFGPLTGLVIDRWGRKRVFVAALVLYGLSGTSGFFLSSLPAILVSRFILGIAVAALTICATALIGDYTHRSKLANSMGRQSLFMAFGNVIFVSLSGVLADSNWRWPFLIYAVSFLILPSAMLLITEPRPTSDAGETSPGNMKQQMPVGRTAFVCMVGFVNMVVYFMVPVYLPFYVRSFSDSNSMKVGGLLALVGLSWGISSSQYYRLRKSLSFERIAMLALVLIATAYLLLSSATGYYIMIVGLVLAGVGLGTILPNLNAWLLSFVPTAVKGRAIGTLVFFVFMGQFFSPVITQPLTTAVGISRSYLIAGMLLVSTTLACGLYEFQQRRRHKGELPNSPEQTRYFS